MNWEESNIALELLKQEFAKLPAKTKDNAKEYEEMAKPLRTQCHEIHKIRIYLLIEMQKRDII